ncbi:MAG: thiamine-phosphate kinase [Candidatus Omnitrophota bacterium]
MNSGELNWIEYLKKRVPKSQNISIGIGDDCAFVRAKSRRLVLKSDLFIENVHFKINETGFKTIGMRAVGRVLSDFAACAALPEFIGVSLGMPSNLKPRSINAILDGILEYCDKFGFSLIGGDTAVSDKLIIDVWAVGTVKKFISRKGACIGDYIFISGRLGMHGFNEPFEPRIRQARYLVQNFKITSMVDISDGFFLDLWRILDASKKGALVWHDKIPVTAGSSDLERGEDYELVFTVGKDEPNIDRICDNFYLIGRVKSKNYGYRIEKNSRISRVKVKGYTHF